MEDDQKCIENIQIVKVRLKIMCQLCTEPVLVSNCNVFPVHKCLNGQRSLAGKKPRKYAPSTVSECLVGNFRLNVNRLGVMFQMLN
jgi:hypothetical protein